MSNLQCPNCTTYVQEDQTECHLCGTELNHQHRKILQKKYNTSTSEKTQNIADLNNSKDICVNEAEGSLINRGRIYSEDLPLQGIVIRVNPPNLETSEFNVYKFLSGIIIVLLLLPIFLLLLILKIALRIAFSIIGFRSGGSIFGNFFWIILGRGAGGKNVEVPVINLLIREENGSERNVRIKGVVVRGSINEGDRVGLNGKWDQGSFLFKKGYNYSANCHIKLKPNRWKFIFIVLLILFTGLTLYIMNQQPPNY